MELILKQYDIPLLRIFPQPTIPARPKSKCIGSTKIKGIFCRWIWSCRRKGSAVGCAAAPSPATAPTSTGFWQNADLTPTARWEFSLCKGLSVDDSYWVVEDGFEGTFEKYNLFENRFSEVLALIAFTGYGSSNRSSLVFQPGIYDKRYAAQVLAQNQRQSHAVQGWHRRRLQHGRRAILRILTPRRSPPPWGLTRFHTVCRNGKVGSVPPASCLPTSTMPICAIRQSGTKGAVSMRLPPIMKIWANRSRRLSAICWCLMR